MELLQSIHIHSTFQSGFPNLITQRLCKSSDMRFGHCLSNFHISNYVQLSKHGRCISALPVEPPTANSKTKRGRSRKKKPENEDNSPKTENNNEETEVVSKVTVSAKKRGRKKRGSPAVEEFLKKSLDNLLSDKDGEESTLNETQTENVEPSDKTRNKQYEDEAIKEAFMAEEMEEQPEAVEEEDEEWPEDEEIDTKWRVRASDYFKENLIRNVVGDDGTLIDWEGEANNYSIKEICAMEWESYVFHPSPLIVLVFERYRRVSDNWKVLKELEKAIQVYWDSNNKLPPRTVKIDAEVERDLASALKVKVTPELLFIRGSKLLYRETDVRTADELVKMIAHFYYNAKRPAWIKETTPVSGKVSR